MIEMLEEATDDDFGIDVEDGDGEVADEEQED
jgi:hypothetical protein